MKKIILSSLMLLVVVFLGACSNEPTYEKGITRITDKEVVSKLGDKVHEGEYIVYFMSDECVYCQKFRPVLNEYVSEEGALPIYMFDIEESETLQLLGEFIKKHEGDLSIEGTPTVLYMKDGEILKTYTGLMEKKDIPVKGLYKSLDGISIEGTIEEDGTVKTD